MKCIKSFKLTRATSGRQRNTSQATNDEIIILSRSDSITNTLLFNRVDEKISLIGTHTNFLFEFTTTLSHLFSKEHWHSGCCRGE